MSNTGARAYPIVGDINQIHDIGLSKRELFAAMAMQGLCTTLNDSSKQMYVEGLSSLESHAVEIADALLTELEKGKESK